MKNILILSFVLLFSSQSMASRVPDFWEFSHFIPQRYGSIFESYSWWNGNLVPTEIHARSDPFRYQWMPKKWKVNHPQYDPFTKWYYRTPKILKTGVLVAIDAGFRTYDATQIENQFTNMTINEEQREINHAKNIGGMTGGWIIGWAGGELGAAIGTCVTPGPGTAIGGVTGGVGGYYVGDKAGEYVSEFTVKSFIKNSEQLKMPKIK